MTVLLVVFGASGDLAKKKTFPALFNLFKSNLLPSSFHIIGYARTDLSREDFHSRITSNIKDNQDPHLAEFLAHCEYMNGKYDAAEDFHKLAALLSKKTAKTSDTLRLFYLALPPSLFIQVSSNIKSNLCVEGAKHRIVVEKP